MATRTTYVAATVLAVGCGVAFVSSRDEPVVPRHASDAASAPALAPVGRTAARATDLAAPRVDRVSSVANVSALDGRNARSIVDADAPAARRGDAAAAFRVYRAEAFCGQLVRLLAASPPGASPFPADWRRAATGACDGLTPRELDERFTFLDEAIRAGDRDAMLAYRTDCPYGAEVADPDATDPNVRQWKANAHAYLETLAASGDERAWSLLASDDALGLVTARDPAAAVRYDTALLVSRWPDVDPRAAIAAVPLGSDASTSSSIRYAIVLAHDAKDLDASSLDAAIAAGTALGRRYPASQASR